MKTTPEALEVTKTPEAVKLFEKHNVLTKKELLSRYEVYQETYKTIIKYEADLSVDMARTMIVPAVVEYTNSLAESIKAQESIVKDKPTALRSLYKKVCKELEGVVDSTDKLEKAAAGDAADKMKSGMVELRKHVDTLEGYVPAEYWPLPSYAEMLFMS